MEPPSARLTGLPGPSAWAYLARCLIAGRPVPGLEAPGFKGPLVMVGADQAWLEDAGDAFAALAPLFEGDAGRPAVFGEDGQGRLGALELLRGGSARLILALPQALTEPLPAPGAFAAQSFLFKSGGQCKRAQALERLAAMGYQRVDFVESPGEFAARGAVLDFFGLEPLGAVRILFDEDSVASIRSFDPGTQATQDMLMEARATPAATGETTGTISDWVGASGLWLTPEALGLKGDWDFGARAAGPFSGPDMAWAEAEAKLAEGYKVVLFSLNKGEDSRMQELLEEKFEPGRIQFLIGGLREGFVHPASRLFVLSASQAFGRRYRPSPRWKFFKGSGGLRFRDLKTGDYVVHQDYGVARYLGLRPIESPGHGMLDCLTLEFRGSDRLFVPMHEFGRVQKFAGAEGKRPRLSSLDTRRWEEVKRQVREGVRELAEELLKTQAERQGRAGHSFPPASSMEAEFAAAFPYDETPDQAKAIAEVMEDMESPVPMDRLVVGDVGFGKTEVAMRAAFKCAAGGFMQAAVLVPTTILADQHYETFSARMRDYPVKLGVLTRFQTPGEQKEILAGLADGTIEIVIGTSRLLQKDIRFKDLGLIIIDEEHRFGVKDKERLKSFRKTVDCLALSATPIPRTLNQAMTGLRGISLIQSAPVGRQPILTKVGPWDEGVAAHALTEELSRGGQAYYVHNRVRSLPECVSRLKKLLPDANFAMVHGKMKGHEIEKVMWEFFHRKFDVLVASTIIESGLDNPTVNTLIVEDAHEFGLAQLYQLRGRIGRERVKAYCYLFYPEGAVDAGLPEEANKRLDALREFADLGGGVKLALRDLEIRGAGDLLGARQHGFMNAVGADFYAQMLDEEVNRLTKRKPAEEPPVAVDIQLPAYIPEDYLPDEMKRLDFYKRILKAVPEEALRLNKELEDLCGPSPAPVKSLFALLAVRALAQRAKASDVTQKGGRVEVTFRPGAPIDGKVLAHWTKVYGKRLRFLRSADGDGIAVDLGEEQPLDWLEGFFLGLLGAPGKK